MPRYFFHVIDGRAVIDTTGLVLNNDTEARIEALRGAGQMLDDEGMNLWLGNRWSLTVVDEDGFVLFNLRFAVDQPIRRHTLLS
ncbi:DUF6894 family protein [Mesorhizobium sp. UC22_110]|jgi:hypothetical protein|uniref:DUF6894 family protein n=1 Tax=unclassified Mesorhizobium TaxID=325217 RepID=UPI0036719B04